MILDNVKPLMLIKFPVQSLAFGTETVEGIVNTVVDYTQWKAFDWVIRRTENTQGLGVVRIPIPFYFYERMADVKSNEDIFTGFMLDSCTENIDLAYPDSPTTQISQGNDGISLNLNDSFMIKNTLEISFRVKNNSTLVTVFRSLMKRMVTNLEIAKEIRFSWYWKSFILTDAKLLDYNEAPIGNTDLTMIKIKLLHAYSEDTAKGTDGVTKYEQAPNYTGKGIPVT